MDERGELAGDVQMSCKYADIHRNVQSNIIYK